MRLPVITNDAYRTAGKPRVIAEVVAVIALALSIPVEAEPGKKSQNVGPAAEIAAIRTREEDYTNGVRNKDIALLASVFADSFIDTSASGKLVNKEEYLELLKSDRSTIESLVVDEEKIGVYGDAAVASSRFVVKAREENGKRADEVGRATDVWVKLNGKWMCVAAHSSIIAD